MGWTSKGRGVHVWRGTEAEEWAEETGGAYGDEYKQKAETLRAIGQGTRNDIADHLRALGNTVRMSGRRVFDVDVLAEMIERGAVAPMAEQCGREDAHGKHEYTVHPEMAPLTEYMRRCDGVRKS